MLVYYKIGLQGFCQRGDKSPPQMTQGGISPSTSGFFGNFCSGFENLITFKCNFKAFGNRIKHSKVLKTHPL
jgi:hypothetical protein